MEQKMQEWTNRIVEKYRRNAPLAQSCASIPYASSHGKWQESPWNAGNGWWTTGFWPGLMWQLHALSGDAFFREEALRTEKQLVEVFREFRPLNHDVGFMYLLSCGAHAKLERDAQAETDTLHAASLLMARFNPAGFIRAWDGKEQLGYAIVDCMMNLPLLYRATRITGDPRFAAVARIHADTAKKHFVREDGSCRHIVEFDPVTGAFVREHGGQGWAVGSSWSRGQAWGLYGFTLLAMNTGDVDDLRTACRIADNFLRHIRPDGLTDCDFDQPEKPERIDNIAGACAACGLLELYRLTGEEAYQAGAMQLLEGMLTLCADWSQEHMGILTGCTAAYHDDNVGTHTNIVYGDYFLVEALAKLAGKDPMLWI